MAKCEALSVLAAKAGYSKGEESVVTADQEVDIPPASSSTQGPDKSKLLMLSLLLLILLLLLFSFSFSSSFVVVVVVVVVRAYFFQFFPSSIFST